MGVGNRDEASQKLRGADAWAEAGRVIKEIRKDRGSEFDTINRYDRSRLVSQESTFPNSRQVTPS